jgi:HSP20 family molecular chaperone IbpA
MNTNVKSFESTTSERKVIDLDVAGYGNDDVSVSTAVIDGGKTFVLTAKGTYTRRTGSTGKLAKRLGHEKVVADTFKWTQTFPSEGTDYDLNSVAYKVRNGILRISINKIEAARGKKVAALADDVNIDAVKTNLDEDGE